MTQTRKEENKTLFQNRNERDTKGRGTKRGELKLIEKIGVPLENRISFLPILQRVLLIYD